MSLKVKDLLSTLRRAIQDACLHFVYPSRCLHCQTLLPPQTAIFCEGCTSLLTLIDPEERCPACFSTDYAKGSRQCFSCAGQFRPFQSWAAAFDYQGPMASLIKRLKYGNQPYLAEGAGAFLALQFERLRWPLPDAIVPVPLSTTHWLDRGYNQSALLADQLSQFLQVPVWHVLKRKSGDYSQAGLSFAQRQTLTKKNFIFKSKMHIFDKTLLIVDDVMTSGKTLEQCADVLWEECPGRLYALTLCCAN